MDWLDPTHCLAKCNELNITIPHILVTWLGETHWALSHLMVNRRNQTIFHEMHHHIYNFLDTPN